MRLRVLGCSGGIGGQQNRTTSFLVDQDILIDAGTGVGDLSLAAIARADAWLAVPGGAEGFAAGTPVDAYMLRD